MSFLTWRWLLPQKLQRSCSLPSDALATVFFYLGSRFIARDTGLGFGSVLGAVSMDDDVVDDAVLLGFLRRHEVVALHVPADLVHVLPGVLAHDLLEAALEEDRLSGMDLDFGRLPLEAAPDLVDEDLGVRQRHPLSFRAAGKQQRAHRHRRADADGLHVGLDELHRVVDREPVVHGAARRVDVDRHVLVGVLRLQVEELGDDQVGDLVVDWGSEEDDALVQESRVDVERALAARGLFDHHRDQRAHSGSLLPGVHSFVSVGEDSLSGVQMLSRARATSAGTRCTSLAIRSSALRRRRSPRRVSAPPLSKTCLIASSASSPCASACSRTSSSISASDTSSPSLSATASSTSSRPTESCASARICSTSCSPVWTPVAWTSVSTASARKAVSASSSSPSRIRRSMSVRRSSCVWNSLAARASSSSSGGGTFSFSSLSAAVAWMAEPPRCGSSTSFVSPGCVPVSARSRSSTRLPAPSSTTRWRSPSGLRTSITTTSPVRAARPSTGASSATDERRSSSSASTTSCGTSGSA